MEPVGVFTRTVTTNLTYMDTTKINVNKIKETTLYATRCVCVVWRIRYWYLHTPMTQYRLVF